MRWPRAGVSLGLCLFSLMLTVSPARTQNRPSAPPNDSTPLQGFKIAGTAVNAITGAPLARANVSIANTRVRAQRTAVLTDEGGRFEFTAVPPGKYELQGSRRGYITSAHEAHEQYSTAIVTGPDFATNRLVLRLMPMALITGHVLDESGEPVRDAQVNLFLEDHGGGMSRVRQTETASTDDRGYFDFNALRPGTYFASVNASPWYEVHPTTDPAGGDAGKRLSPALDVAYPETYFGGATDSDAAAPIVLKGGQTQEIEIRLAPVPALHLLVRVPVNTPGETNAFHVPVLQKRVFDLLEYVRATQVETSASPGVVEMTGIPAGRYEVGMRSSDPAESRQFSEINLEHDGQDLNPTLGETLGKLTVKLRIDEPLPKQYGVGLRDRHQKNVAFVPGDPGKQVSFEAVKPGKYALVVAAPGKWYAVTRTISAMGETPGHDVDVLSGPTDVTADLVEGVVGIEGAVHKNGKPLAGVMVVLVPNDPEAHVDLFRRDQSDFDGTFSLGGVIPGTYTIVAVEDAWGFEWLKAGVLARYVQHGQNLTIGEKMRGTVHLPDAVEVQQR
jgi:hypothetical protein